MAMKQQDKSKHTTARKVKDPIKMDHSILTCMLSKMCRLWSVATKKDRQMDKAKKANAM